MPYRNNKLKAKLEHEVTEKVALILRMANKLYTTREVVLVHKSGTVECPEEIVYQMYTRPNLTSEYQLVQEGQLEAMRRYLHHESGSNYYRVNRIATDPNENVLPFVQLPTAFSAIGEQLLA